MILSEIVSPDSFVARSVNLERDIGNENTLISGPLGFHASKSLLTFALLNPLDAERVSADTVKKTFNALNKRGILHYREYADEYRLWEGTDFDASEILECDIRFQCPVRRLNI